MLDVHAPHGKMESVKDFALHLFTITVGLLIALGLEGCVERYHKAETRREAEANLRQELTQNRDEMKAALKTIAVEQKHLVGALEFLAARKVGKTAPITPDQLAFENRILSDASWRTASATGALSLMEYKQVQAYAGAYLIQEEWVRLEEATLDDFLQMVSYVVTGFDPEKFTAEEAVAVEPVVRHGLAHLQAMKEVGEELSAKYDEALKEK